MFISRTALNLIVASKDEAFRSAVDATAQARELVLAAKQAEIDFLKSHIAKLERAVQYEKTRADTLVDRLLVRDAKVAAVAPAAVAAAVEKDVKTAARRDEVQRVFDEVASVGADPVPPAEPRAFDFAGGGRGVAA